MAGKASSKYFKKVLELSRNQSYSLIVPKKPLLVLPKPKLQDPPVPGAKQGSRVIFGIGGHRFAVDFYRKVTELNAEPAPVLPMKRRKTKVRLARPK